ncbi:hypothetical protein AAC387_Pa03g1839 [Persea americana]
MTKRGSPCLLRFQGNKGNQSRISSNFCKTVAVSPSLFVAEIHTSPSFRNRQWPSLLVCGIHHTYTTQAEPETPVSAAIQLAHS